MSQLHPQTITCRAAVCWAAGEEVKVEEIEVAPPKPSEVRVKMLYASLCHSDILLASGFPIPLFPRVLGHEGVGIVESVGEGVAHLKEGDIVIPTYLGECRDCENCASDRTNMCLKRPLQFSGLMQDGTSRLSTREGGDKLYHCLSCSTWAEYAVVDANYVFKIDSRMDLPHACLISCGFSTGYGAAWKDAQVEKGSTIAVIGLGAVGLGVVVGARKQGASRIIGVDINEMKCEKGRSFGMTDFINPTKSNESISESIKRLTGGLGVDYSFQCTADLSLINQAIDSIKPGKGKIILLGAGKETTAEINVFSLFWGLTIKGCSFGGLKPQSDLPHVVERCINKEIQLDQLLTHEVPLEDISKAYEFIKQPDCVKVLINMNQSNRDVPISSSSQ